MKKILALLAIVVLIATTGIIAVGKKLPSVGYVLVGATHRWWMVNETSSRIPILNKTWL